MICQRLGKIKSGALVATIIACACVSIGMDSEWMEYLDTVLNIMFDLPVVIPHVSNAHGWLKTTLNTYICPFSEYHSQNPLLGFFSDPLQAGQYTLDGQKIACATTKFLESLLYPWSGKSLWW